MVKVIKVSEETKNKLDLIRDTWNDYLEHKNKKVELTTEDVLSMLIIFDMSLEARTYH